MRALLLMLFSYTLLHAAPEDEIRKALQASQDAWNRGDIPTFMSYYENSPETTFVGRSVTTGFEQVLERYKKGYPNREAMGELTFTILKVRVLDNANAIAIGRFALKRTPAGGGAASGIWTLVFHKGGSGWKIVHDHTAADPAPAPSN